jgi:hypothetical protein
MKGTATFSTAEAGLGIEIKFTTAGHADVFGSAVTNVIFTRPFGTLILLETDQTFLAQTVRELKAIVCRFPVGNR